MEPHGDVGAWLCTCHRAWQHQGYPEGGGNLMAAETSTMTFKEQLRLNEAGEQIPAPSSEQRQESQQGTDRFIMFLGAAPLHFAGDKVSPCSQGREMGGDGYSKRWEQEAAAKPPGLAALWVAVADAWPASAIATSTTSFPHHSQEPGHGTGVSAASWLPPGKEGLKTRINTAFKVNLSLHPLLHSLVKAFMEGDLSAGIQQRSRCI